MINKKFFDIFVIFVILFGITLSLGRIFSNVHAQSIGAVSSGTTPPARSNGAPTGTLSAGTTQATLSLTTNENVTCRYSTSPVTAYDSMPNTFSATSASFANTYHYTGLLNLQSGATYTYYVRCKDIAGNTNTDDYAISFSVASPSVSSGGGGSSGGGAISPSSSPAPSSLPPVSVDTTPPVISNIGVSGITGNSATISWTTNEPATTQVDYGINTSYGSTASLEDASIRGLFQTTHLLILSGLQPGFFYHYRIKSQDAAGNISFSGDQVFSTLQSSGGTSLGSPASTPSPLPAVSPAPFSSSINVGDRILVSFGVSVRSTPAIQRNRLGVQRAGAGGVVVSGPVNANGYTWWNISYDSGPDGWSAGAFLKKSIGAAPPLGQQQKQAPLTQQGITTQSISSQIESITWTTTQPVYGSVEYKTSPFITQNKEGNLFPLTSMSAVNYTKVTSTTHDLCPTGLSPNTTYYARVWNKDTQGVETVSSPFNFTTPSPPSNAFTFSKQWFGLQLSDEWRTLTSSGEDTLAWNAPWIRGVRILEQWDEFEPAQGQFVYSFTKNGKPYGFDDQINGIVQMDSGKNKLNQSKFVRLVLQHGGSSGGAFTPSWVEDGVENVVGSGNDKYLRWDPQYQCRYWQATKELGQHYDANPNIEAISIPTNSQTGEMPVSNTLHTNLNNMGYSDNDIARNLKWLYESQFNVFSENFPHKRFDMNMGQIKVPDPDSVPPGQDVSLSILDELATLYPNRIGYTSTGAGAIRSTYLNRYKSKTPIGVFTEYPDKNSITPDLDLKNFFDTYIWPLGDSGGLIGFVRIADDGLGISTTRGCGGPIGCWKDYQPLINFLNFAESKFAGYRGSPPLPPLTASCSVSPVTAQIGQNVMWTAVASGGKGGPYTYSWLGDAPLAGKTGNPATVAYSTTGTKSGSVVVSDGTNTVTQGCSNTVSVTSLIPPTVSITSPSDGSTVSGVITVSANATDDKGVLGVQFTLDGANLGAEVTAAPYQISWDTKTASNGSHTLSAVARDTDGNLGNASPLSVTVSNDVTPPNISAVSATNITYNSATVTWTTDEPATSQVEYGLTQSYGSITSVDNSLVLVHSVSIANLSSSATYHFRVYSKDASGNAAVSLDYIFTTNPAPDLTPPNAVTNLSASGARSTSFTLGWTAPSDPPSGGSAALYDIRYSILPLSESNWASATQVTGEPAPALPGTTESYIVAGLTPSTLYYAGLKSTDAAGNVSALSNTASITTTAPLPSPILPPPPPSNFKALGATDQILLLWKNPTDFADFVQVKIVRTVGVPPSSIDAGTVIYEGNRQEFSDRNISLGLTYYYGIVSIDRQLQASSMIVISVRPGQSTPADITATLSGRLRELQAVIPSLPAAARVPFAVVLYRGLRGDTVVQLQRLLIAQKFLGTKYDTGFFGPLTEQAVQKFQCVSGIVCGGTPLSTGYGSVGPRTRAKLNELLRVIP